MYLRKTAFAFFDISFPHFSLPFLVLQSFQLLSKTCLGLWLVSHFLKVLMCFDFVCCAGLLFLMFQKADARKMMTFRRNCQSLLILLINFIQFLELVFVNKFAFSSMKLNNDIYFVFIVFFTVFFFFFFWAVLLLIFINYFLIRNVSVENNYFYYIIIINCIKNNGSWCLCIQL